MNSTRFRPAIDIINASGASATDIISAVNPSSPLVWLTMILLLDQIPRNCFRGDESKLVFQRFDPLAEEIALRAIDTGIPTQSPQVRYRLSYRFWFLLPLEHSESLAVHKRSMELHEDMAKDFEEFIAGDVSAMPDKDERRCYSVFDCQRDALKRFLDTTIDFERRHKAIIEKFGRYPHRNQALGRVSTPEEIEYLKNGGETFGG